MEGKGIINGLKSKYILSHINNFIKDKYFTLKLFSRSKKCQNKFEINYSLCYKKYLDKIQFYLNEYLYTEEEKEKNLLKNRYDNFILKNKLNKEVFEKKIIYGVVNEQDEKNNENYINVDSPLLEILSKTKNFDKIYTLYISQKIIDEYNIKDDCIKAFRNLNNSNIKYSSIYYILNEKAKLDCFKELGINYNNIKKLKFKYNGNEVINDESSNDRINILNLFNNLEELILIGNENIIKILENVNLIKLKKLCLSNNKISDINALEKAKIDELEILNLHNNEISNINILEGKNFKKLKELYLSRNKISDINVFKKVQFDKLEILDLSDNQISDISFLENDNLREIKELYLSWNKISDLKVIEKVKLDKLKILILYYNEISDINILENANLSELKELNLSCNKISDIRVLKKVALNNLEILYLNSNEISNINVLENVCLRELRELNLSDNKISDIRVLNKVKMDKLETIDLYNNNKLDKNKYVEIIDNSTFKIYI